MKIDYDRTMYSDSVLSFSPFYIQFRSMEKSFIKLVVFILFGETLSARRHVVHLQHKQGLVMPVPFQDIQITDSISYPDHICDIPPSTVDDGHIPYSNLHSRSSFFFFAHSFDLSSCWILSDVKRHNVCFCHSLPLTRHIKWIHVCLFKWRYFPYFLCLSHFHRGEIDRHNSCM